MYSFLHEEKRRLLDSFKSTATLYIAYFRLEQIICLCSLIWALWGLFLEKNFWQSAPPPVPIWLSSSITLGGILLVIIVHVGLILLCEFALRQVQKHKFIGIVIGIIFSILTIPSYTFFLMGIFGLYCFFSKRFQNSHQDCFPQWYKAFLSAIKLNFIKKK